MKPIALGFDFDHTLGMDHKLERTAFVQLMQETQAAAGRALDIARASEIIDRQIAFYRAGRGSLSHAFEQAFEAIAGRIAPTGAFEEFRERAVGLVEEFVTPVPGAEELLSQLDALAMPYAILTNGWNPLQQRKADAIGFSQPVFVSDDIGVRKPSVHAFNVLRDYFDRTPERIWYVGDDPLNDVVGALGAGMRAIWFDGDQQKYPTNVPAPTAIVTSISDILSLIA